MDPQRRGDRARLGAAPRGFRAPYWSLSERTLDLAAELGFRYDSSLMADDVRLYRVRRGDHHDSDRLATSARPGRSSRCRSAGRSTTGRISSRARKGVGPMSAPSKVEEIWTGELRYAWDREPGGVLTITMHPEAIGRGHRLLMLERFIAPPARSTASSSSGSIGRRTLARHRTACRPDPGSARRGRDRAG